MDGVKDAVYLFDAIRRFEFGVSDLEINFHRAQITAVEIGGKSFQDFFVEIRREGNQKPGAAVFRRISRRSFFDN